jgi:cytochrome b6-f complex iron-sulfur subunit
MPDENVSRRDFLEQAGRGAAFAAGAVVLGGAGAARAADDPKLVALPLGEHQELAKVGGYVEAEMPDGTEIIVAKVDDDKFACCSLRCTHANCKVTYDKQAKQFVCPCHHSQFDLTGAVVHGPARKPLRSFAAEAAVVVRDAAKDAGGKR